MSAVISTELRRASGQDQRQARRESRTAHGRRVGGVGMATSVLPESLLALNPANPLDRDTLVDEEKRMQVRFDRAQHMVEADSHTQGYRHSERLIERRDLLDAQLSALHRHIHSVRAEHRQRCRSASCDNTALPVFTGSGYCASCLHHAQNGTRPDFNPTTLPAPAINR